jgi:hypothetical protein
MHFSAACGRHHAPHESAQSRVEVYLTRHGGRNLLQTAAASCQHSTADWHATAQHTCAQARTARPTRAKRSVREVMSRESCTKMPSLLLYNEPFTQIAIFGEGLQDRTPSNPKIIYPLAICLKNFCLKTTAIHGLISKLTDNILELSLCGPSTRVPVYLQTASWSPRTREGCTFNAALKCREFTKYVPREAIVSSQGPRRDGIERRVQVDRGASRVRGARRTRRA